MMTPAMLRSLSVRWYRFRRYDLEYAIPRWMARRLPYPLVRACVHRAALRVHWETRRPLNDVTYYDIWATWERPR